VYIFLLQSYFFTVAIWHWRKFFFAISFCFISVLFFFS
jgi:hypothetical protein